VLVGAFIVEDGDEILSITTSGQVVRSPINADFRPTGRSTMGVKFVSPKKGDSVAVVTRSVEAKVEEDLEEAASEDSSDVAADAVEEVAAREDETVTTDPATEEPTDPESGSPTDPA
jgi:DNA gyrase subunit A